MKFTIEIKQSDIDDGEEGSCDNCPAAKAVKRSLCRNVCVTRTDIWKQTSRSEPIESLCRLPAEAQKFIGDFDAGRHVNPFSFEIEIK